MKKIIIRLCLCCSITTAPLLAGPQFFGFKMAAQRAAKELVNRGGGKKGALKLIAKFKKEFSANIPPEELENNPSELRSLGVRAFCWLALSKLDMVGNYFKSLESKEEELDRKMVNDVKSKLVKWNSQSRGHVYKAVKKAILETKK